MTRKRVARSKTGEATCLSGLDCNFGYICRWRPTPANGWRYVRRSYRRAESTWLEPSCGKLIVGSIMNDQARDKLSELLSHQGQSLLTLGRTCEMLIAQACAEYPEEAKALIQVEKLG